MPGPSTPTVLPRAAQTPGQRRLRQPTAQIRPTPRKRALTRRHRSDSARLLWQVFSRQHADLPRSGQGGTNSFFAYATAYLVLHGERFTLAVSPVTRSVLLKEVLQELLALVRKAGLKTGLLLLDRGFYSVEVIRYLQRARRPFLMPVVCHGRKANHPLGPSGSNVFKLMKKSGWFTHTLQDGKKNKATVSICVKRARWKDRHGKRKTETRGCMPTGG